MAYWAPQLGPQLMAATCPADHSFFGGSRGGGKSDCLLGRQLRGAELYDNNWNGLVIRRKYKDFLEIRRRIDGWIAEGMECERIGGDQMTNYWRFGNGAQVTLPAINELKQVNDFVGHQYTEIGIDEATTFPFFTQMVDKLKGSNRSPAGVPCHMFSTGNPGGPGHLEVKEYFKLGTEYFKKYPPGKVFYDDSGESRVFIPSFLKDNKILCENDPKYVNRLLSIRDPLLKKAWIDGDWDVFIGQAFKITERHIIEPIPIPKGAPIYMTYDWGWGAPFSIGWWWVDLDNRLYRFGEWYGWTGTPNEGLRLLDSEVAKGIIQREKDYDISDRDITRLTGHDSFNKRPDYKGGGQGPSTAEVFVEHGLYLIKADSNRDLKIRAFRERMAVPEDDSMPMLVVYDTCTHFLRTIPYLAMDETNVEYIAEGQEEHCFDDAAQIAMARPISMEYESAKPNPIDKRLKDLYAGISSDDRVDTRMQRYLENDADLTERDIKDEIDWDDDGTLIETI